MFWSRFPFARLTGMLALGIIAALHVNFTIPYYLWITLSWMIAYLGVGLLAIYNRFYNWQPLVGVLALGAFFWTGYTSSLRRDERQADAHLIRYENVIEAYEGVVNNIQEQEHRNNAVLQVKKARIRGKWRFMEGQVIVYLPKDFEITYGDHLLVKGMPQKISSLKNPNTFNYPRYLALSNIYHQQWLKQGQFIRIKRSYPYRLIALGVWAQQACKAVCCRYVSKPEAQGTVLALLLGTKEKLSPATQKAHMAAGTMHALAVSGLHVEMIYMILGLLLFPFRRWSWLFTFFLALGLWFYALVAGLSPSVLRAVTTVSFALLAKTFRRKPNPYNILAVSAFFILLLKPYALFSIGFQLSYGAVWGILFFQPKLYKLVTFSHPWADKWWAVTTVSIAAQLATAPLCAYYFHHFSTYFLLANWVIVPLTFVTLGLSVLLILLSTWQIPSIGIGWVLSKLIFGMNAFVEWVMHLPYSQIKPLWPSTTQICCLYSVGAYLILFFRTRKFIYLVGAGTTACIWAGGVSWQIVHQRRQQKIVFYSVPGFQVAAFVKGLHSTLLLGGTLEGESAKCERYVIPSHDSWGIRRVTKYTYNTVLTQDTFPIKEWAGGLAAVWHNKTVVWINKVILPSSWSGAKIPVDILVVENNAVRDIRPWLVSFDIKFIVLSTSNKPRLAQTLADQAQQAGIGYHLLHQGAWEV